MNDPAAVSPPTVDGVPALIGVRRGMVVVALGADGLVEALARAVGTFGTVLVVRSTVVRSTILAVRASDRHADQPLTARSRRQSSLSRLPAGVADMVIVAADPIVSIAPAALPPPVRLAREAARVLRADGTLGIVRGGPPAASWQVLETTLALLLMAGWRRRADLALTGGGRLRAVVRPPGEAPFTPGAGNSARALPPGGSDAGSRASGSAATAVAVRAPKAVTARPRPRGPAARGG